MSRFTRTRLAAAVAVLAVSVVVTPAGGVSCEAHELLDDLWTRIPVPDLSAGNRTMNGYDVAQHSADHLVVTNGVAIGASDDAGCTWAESELPDDSALPDPGTLTGGEGVRVVSRGINQVRFAGWGSLDVWALGQSDVVVDDLATTQPRVLYSRDGGQRFTAAQTGLPQFGRPVAIRGIRNGAAVLLFRTTLPNDGYQLYTTSDGGTTWELAAEQLPQLEDFVVDNLSAATAANPVLWAWSSAAVYSASLRDPQLRQATGVTGRVRAVELTPNAAGRTVVAAYVTDVPERFVSYDGGASFAAVPAPMGIQSVSGHLFLPGLRAISSMETNVLIEAPTRPNGVDFSPREANVSEVRFVSSLRDIASFPLYAFHGLALYRRDVPSNFRPPPPPPVVDPVDVNLRKPRPEPPPPASIKPAGEVVRLRQGRRATVPYTVTLPPVPTPLDVFFMTDSTGSMSQTIAGVQQGVQDIVDGLAATGINLNFGVADFRDHPAQPNDASTYPYKRRRAVGPIDSELAEALEGITTGGGTTDGHDAGLEAIYQAVTGAGRTDPLLARGQLIPPGQGAEFREKAMKVVLVATDDNFRHPGPTNPTYPGPSIDTVSKVLQDAGVFLVGLEVDTNSGSARADMERLAEDSGAVAPAKGVDCDGDDQPDLVAGEPIVCTFDPDAGAVLADAFVAMLAGIKDLADVTITLPGANEFIRPQAPLTYTDVNVKAPNTFELPVEFRCTKANAGTETAVRIVASSRGRDIVSTNATFECLPPRPRPPDIPPVVPPAVVAALVPPPPPPPAPVTQVNPNVNPNPNPNPQINANAGFAAQEEEQLQLALAQQNDGISWEDEMAMSGLDRTGPPMPALAWATAFAMTGAAAFGVHLARRTRPATSPVEYR